VGGKTLVLGAVAAVGFVIFLLAFPATKGPAAQKPVIHP
jgi:hypothetical protein